MIMEMIMNIINKLATKLYLQTHVYNVNKA